MMPGKDQLKICLTIRQVMDSFNVSSCNQLRAARVKWTIREVRRDDQKDHKYLSSSVIPAMKPEA
jgi:hypothetical protein